jgi:type II secretory pathway component PulM
MIASRWIGLVPREKLLITIAAALTIGIVLVFGLVSPLVKAKADASQRLDRVSQDYALIEQGLRRIGPEESGSQRPASDSDAFRLEVIRMAQQSGLSVDRVQAGQGGRVQVVISDVSPPLMYAWLEEVARLPGGETYAATITSRADAIQAVIEFRGSQP